MNESMVIHAEYVDDLPEELKSRFLMYCFNYGIHGEEPQLQGLESVIWIKAKRRIDTDKSLYNGEKLRKAIAKAKFNYKNKKASAKDYQLLKENGVIDNKGNILEYSEYSDNSGISGIIPPYTYTNTPSVYDIDNVSVNDSVSVYDNESVSEFEHVSVSDTVSDAETLPQKDYSQAIFNLFKDSGLPCCKGNYASFIQRDFKNALEHLKGYHSDEVIQAVKNYIYELKSTESFISQKLSFDSFVNSKLFNRMLPDNYSVENNRSFEQQTYANSLPYYDQSTRTIEAIKKKQKEFDDKWEKEHGKQNSELS